MECRQRVCRKPNRLPGFAVFLWYDADRPGTVAPEGLRIRQAWLAADTVRRLPVLSVRQRHDRICNGRICLPASCVHTVSGNAPSTCGRPLVPGRPGGAAATRGILPGRVEHDHQCHAPSSGLAWRHGPSDRMVSLLASSRAGQPLAMSGDNNRRQASL
ncbi:hypothetical protein LHK_02824 [Laribacter hongkongensis HLHK9]|uniref:Uncharacterized protein n=1 Tax=Laribacter hongkongensis (strain HLHK9) TaxID=557598 RepID=C1DDH2_LARHH|nr:hypothetical protein LHK_02824 [Laribacter hongkongensis HLHK9]